MIIGDLQLELRDQHSAAFDAANFADAERHVLARNEGAGRDEHALHPGPRIGRPAYDLHRIAGAGVDHADTQPIGVRMLLGGDHTCDGKRGEHLAAIDHSLDFEPDHRELVDDRGERSIGIEMLLEPSQGEFHHPLNPPARVGKSSGRKP